MARNKINEATGDGSYGKYSVPLSPGLRLFNKKDLAPFTTPVSEYIDADLSYDSYDGSLDVNNKTANKMEKNAEKIANYNKNHPSDNDDEGDNLNNWSGKIIEYVEITPEMVSEDLGVWFGTKKKPKGSSQPKGPWVNICRKVDGKHPPCGRDKASDKSYPKCRAAGVAGKMTDAQKKAACAQKRKAEKTHSKSGTGNKPKMVSYKPKKVNENKDIIIERLVLKVIKKMGK
jgi:hypothetical protein